MSKKRGKNKKIKYIVLGILTLFIMIGLWGSFKVFYAVRDLPHPEDFASFKPIQSTKIFDRTGKILLYEIHGDQNRTIVNGDKIPKYAKYATIAIEDENFYLHSAFDTKSIIRAFIKNIIRGRIVQGGSTITQQLVKNVFLTPEKTIERKIKELILAYWIEKKYTKDQILDFYLNQISYGSNVYGIESAAQTFFGKHAKNLTIAESAYLASLIKAPSYYSPWGKHKDELRERKNYVLKKMYELGFIDDQQFDAAKNEKVTFLTPNLGTIKAPHFVMMVKKYLENKYGKDMVENGGLRIITTLDWSMQNEAEKVVIDGAKRNKKLYNGSNAALMAQDPKTGQILALVGSANYFDDNIDGQFDVATQGLRQPGSTFKPFVYMAAFKKGFTPDTIIFDVPTEFTSNNSSCPIYVDFSINNNRCFHPQNFDDMFRGPVSMKEALAESINVPAVKTLYLAGVKSSIDIAHKFGITTLKNPSKYGLSLVLGSGEVKLVDLVNAYSTIAQNGIKHNQSFILEIDDSKGNILEKYQNLKEKVIEEVYPETINGILSDINLRSKLFHASLGLTEFSGYQVALKTGTTNDYRDAWTIGYTPFLVVGVWAGNSNYKPMKRHGSSILAALPIWNKFFEKFINNYQPETFKPQTISLESQLPMLNGKYIINKNTQYPQIHSILYYINKDNPTVLRSENSKDIDSQFYNWEMPVIEWARTHIPDFSLKYNKPPFYIQSDNSTSTQSTSTAQD